MSKKRSSMAIRLTALLAVTMLFSMCLVSGTFAKYTTSKSMDDNATVAKWGVEITGTAADTFTNTYAKDDSSFTLAANTVVAAGDVVAPGTFGSMAAFTIAGTPEVAVNVKFEGALELGDKWLDANGDYYCPIEITVSGTTYKGTAYPSADAFETAVNNAIADFDQNYEANTDLSTIGADAPVISWKWAFPGDDVKDTFLGDQAVAAGNAATIALEVTVTVTQID